MYAGLKNLHGSSGERGGLSLGEGCGDVWVVTNEGLNSCERKN